MWLFSILWTATLEWDPPKGSLCLYMSHLTVSLFLPISQDGLFWFCIETYSSWTIISANLSVEYTTIFFFHLTSERTPLSSPMSAQSHGLMANITLFDLDIFFNRLQSSLKLRASETHMGTFLWHCNLFPWEEFSMCCWSVGECIDHTVDAPKRIVLCKILIKTFFRAMEEIGSVFWIILLCYH